MNKINEYLYIDIKNGLFIKELKKKIIYLNEKYKDKKYEECEEYEEIIYIYIKENMNKNNKSMIFNTLLSYFEHFNEIHDGFLYKIYDLIKLEEISLRIYNNYKYKTISKTISLVFYFARIKNFNKNMLDYLTDIIEGKDLINDYYFVHGFEIDDKYSIKLVKKLLNYVKDNKLNCNEYKLLKRNINLCLEYFDNTYLEKINIMLTKNKI